MASMASMGWSAQLLGLPSGPSLPAAACRSPDINPGLFFPERGEPTAPAKKICAGCPNRIDCREWALSVPPRLLAGVWGGTSQRERVLLRRAALRHDRHMTTVELAVPSANGHEAEVANGGYSPPLDETVSTCSQCDRPAKPGRPTCGQPACVAARRAQSKRRKPATSRRPASVDTKPASVDRFDPIAALLGAGATLRSVELELAGQSWVLTRSR